MHPQTLVAIVALFMTALALAGLVGVAVAV